MQLLFQHQVMRTVITVKTLKHLGIRSSSVNYGRSLAFTHLSISSLSNREPSTHAFKDYRSHVLGHHTRITVWSKIRTWQPNTPLYDPRVHISVFKHPSPSLPFIISLPILFVLCALSKTTRDRSRCIQTRNFDLRRD